MKKTESIAIIGGGFTGLTAAYELAKAHHRITVFEKEKELGGLAHGFREPNWDWYLEKAYHHWFTNDLSVLSLLGDLGLKDELIIKRPITANFWRERSFQFDNPRDFLNYPGLTALDKVCTGALLAFLKLNPFWQPLESLTAETLARRVGGDHAWKALWEPLMVAKFDNYSGKVAASWLWARIKKRSTSLSYIKGGFQTLVKRLKETILAHGGIVYTNTAITSIRNGLRGKYLVLWKKQKREFDRILLTVPTAAAIKLCPLILNTNPKPLEIPHLHAQMLILETRAPILKDVYWLNILDRNFPFLAVVAHTNFMNKKYYGNHHLTYFGNYLPQGHSYLSLTKEQLLKLFLPYVKRLNPSFRQLSIVNCQLFTGWYAQPVHELHYSKLAPPLKTPLEGIYLANLDSIYPWDRGTNYAVELGQKAARLITQEISC